VPKLVWRVKLVAELEPGVATETEVARIERGEEAGLADLGLRLEEAKRLTAALQAEIVTAQVATAGERRRRCTACDRPLAGKGHYRTTFRSLFGAVPVRVGGCWPAPAMVRASRRASPRWTSAARVAPELAYVTARYAALAPFGKGRRAPVGAASTRRRGERGHGAEPDAARRRGCRAAARGRDRERPAAGWPDPSWSGSTDLVSAGATRPDSAGGAGPG
jgi:hypothetical protein